MTSKLNERVMLVALHISSWGGMMFDQEVSEEISASHKADLKTAGRYNKRLVNSKFMIGVSSAHNRARRVHRVLTLPWDDDGTRILTNVGYVEYVKAMKEARQQVEREVKAFCAGLDTYITEAKPRLGGMFNVDDYPSADELKDKFGFDVELKPMPEAADFRVKLSDDQTKGIIKDIQRRTDLRLENAMKDVFARAKEVIGHMSETLHAYVPAGEDSKAKGIIRDKVVQNVFDLAHLMTAFNITDDPRITELQKQMLADLTDHSPEMLRSDAKVRQLTMSKADKILKKVESYLK